LLHLGANAAGVADLNGHWIRVGGACDGGRVELVITAGERFTSVSDWPEGPRASSWGVFRAVPATSGDHFALGILHIGHKDFFDNGGRRVRDFFFNKAVSANLSLSLERIDGRESLVLRGHDHLRAGLEGDGACPTNEALFQRL
jgi:hypothetical protein